MKNKALALFVFALSAFSTNWVCALYNGNPSLPMMPERGLFFSKEAWITLKTGYEWDDLFDRKLILEEHRPHLKRQAKKYEAMGNFGVLTLGCNDRVELYGVLGSVKANLDYHPYSNDRLKIETDCHFAWMVGGRAILAYWGDVQLGVDAKFFQFNPEIDHLKRNGQSLDSKNASYNYQEWQVGFGVSYRIKFFAPYGGLKYSNVRAKFHHLEALGSVFPEGHFTMKNQYPIGIFLGCGFSPERAFNINFEARLFDETAVTLSGDLRY